MKLVKKLTAYLVVLSMILGMTSAYAVGTPIKTDEYSDQRGDLSYIFLGTSPANQDVSGRYGAAYTGNLDGLTKDFEWEKDGLVWIGIQVKNMSRLRGMFNSDVTTSNKTSGLGSFSLSLAYDTDYFTLPSNTGNYGAAQSATQLTNYPVSYQASKALYDFSEETGITYQEMKEASASASIRDLTLSQTNDSKVGIYKASASVNDTNMQQDDCLLFQDGADPTYGWDGMTPNPVTDDPFTMFVIPLKMVGDTAPAAGTKVIEGYFDMAVSTMIVGTGATEFVTYAYDTRRDEGGTNGDTNLNNYFNISALVDLFPPSSTRQLQSISVKDGPYTIPAQYVGKALNVTGLALTATYNEAPLTEDVTMSSVTYKYATANSITDATSTDLTDVPAALTADQNEKYLYAVYGGKTVCLGQLSVSAKAITGIAFDDANSTFNDAGNTYYTSQNILDVLTGNGAKTLTADITYNNGDTDGADVAYAAFAGKGIALYQVKDNKLATIGTTDKFAESNTFYIAETGKAGQDPTAVTIKSAAITVSATTDTIVIKSIANAKLAYATAEDTAGDKRNVIDFSTADITTYSKSVGDHDNTNTTQKVSALGTDKLIFYYGDTSTAAYDAGKVITSGTTTYTSDLKDKYVFVIPADDTAATPVLVGQLKNRAISTSTGDVGTGYTVTGITTDANTQYGAKLGNGAKITVKYDNGNTKELSYSDFATESITMKIVKADGTTEVVASATDQTVLTPAMNGGFVQFFYNGTKIGTSTPLTVNKKTVGYSSNANLETPYVGKVYDGTTKLAEGDKAKVEFKIDESDLEPADNLSGKLEITGVTYSYNSKNVAYEKAIVASETSQGSLAVSGSTDDVTKFNANYTLAPLTANTTVYNRGSITAKTLNVTTITGVPSVEVGATTGLTGTATLALKNESATDTNSNIVKGDVVTLTYKYEYNAADVNAVGTPDVTITTTGTEGSTQLGLSGTDAGNYTLGTLPTTKGTVVNKKLNTITINTAPTKATYTYPDTKLDLTGIKFDLNYEGATTPTTIDLAQFITDGGIITLTDAAGQPQTITATNATGVISLPYGETTLNIAYGGKTTTTKVTTNKKPIKLSEITFAASKVYGQDDAAATKTATPPTGAIEAADADAVQFTFDAAFVDNAAGENKNVTISKIALTGAAAGNYVIVDENGAPITAETTTIATGTISQGEQTAPAKPAVKVDSATNNIIVEGPLGENIEYSIDGGQTWQSDVTFTGLTKGTNYTVQARVKATADGNYAPSEPTASEPVTTFKYYVAVYKKNAKEGSEPAYKVYTNTTSAASKADLNALLPKKISNLKEFYTDAPATIKVEYPYTLAAENVLYYTTSGGGGGGTGSSVTITLDKTSVSGEVGNSEKVTATIKGSTATPKWTSSNEKVATVDQNGNITFVGEGKATVKINVSGTVKSVAVTVTAAKATPVPTVEPTVEPTDKPSEPDTPIIDVNYTKPYASGYEDDTFRPENKITRAELAAMIARLSYGDDLPDGAYVSSFPDIEADAWFNKYVGYLEDKNVLNGYEDGTFRPYDTVTRGEISTVIARAQRYELISYSGIFADVTDSDWAKDYIQTLASQGIISGYEDGTFGPYSPLSRAEAVTIINNVLAPSTPIVTFTPNDIAGHWAEANIILAVNERMLGGTWSEDLTPAEIPTPEVTEPAPVEVPEDTDAPVVTDETVVPEGELDPTVKDELVLPTNPEAGAVTDEEQKFIVK